MSHLLAVRDRQAATDRMFEPLQDTIILLERYGVTIPEQVYTQMEVSKERAFRMINIDSVSIQPLQNNFLHRNCLRNGMGLKRCP